MKRDSFSGRALNARAPVLQQVSQREKLGLLEGLRPEPDGVDTSCALEEDLPVIEHDEIERRWMG